VVHCGLFVIFRSFSIIVSYITALLFATLPPPPIQKLNRNQQECSGIFYQSTVAKSLNKFLYVWKPKFFTHSIKLSLQAYISTLVFLRKGAVGFFYKH
jgi:hypothetical protein